MASTHVIIISAQPVPNLIPVISMKPERVIMLVSQQMVRQAERLRAFLENRGISVSEQLIDPYDMAQVEQVCVAVIKEEQPASIILNATGGTKIAAFGAFAAFRHYNLPIFYFDPQQWRIVSLDGSGTPPHEPCSELSVADYLAVHGKKVISDIGTDEVFENRLPLTRWLSEHLPQSGLMPVLNMFVTESLVKKTFPFARQFERYFNPAFTPLLKRLNAEGIIRWEAKTKTVIFESDSNAAYIGGFWLEEYVFDVVRGLAVHDVRRNVRVFWDSSGITNEFDVVFTDRSRLFLISCKTSKLGSEKQYKDKNPVYELDSLKDDAAGLYGKGILVSASPLGTELKKRADTLELVSINAGDLKWLASKLKIALKQTGHAI